MYPAITLGKREMRPCTYQQLDKGEKYPCLPHNTWTRPNYTSIRKLVPSLIKGNDKGKPGTLNNYWAFSN